MNVPNPDVGKVAGGSLQMRAEISSAQRQAARTSQSITPKAVAQTERGNALKSEDAGVRLQISGKQGPNAELELHRMVNDSKITAPQSDTQPQSGLDPIQSTYGKFEENNPNDPLKETLQKLEEEEEERKKRSENQITNGKNQIVDTNPGSTPEETIEKARLLRSRVLTSDGADPEDMKLAAKAAEMEAEARAKITERQREAAGITTDPIDILEHSREDSRENKILNKIGSTYGAFESFEDRSLVSALA